jgi:hypothetical protein
MADEVDVEAIRKQVAGAFAQIANDLDGLNRRAKDATSSSDGIDKLDIAMSGLAKTMLGTAGVAGGLALVWRCSDSGS